MNHDIQGWANKWDCAVEMAAQAEATLEILKDVNIKFNDYIRSGGVISEPTSIDNYWELGRNMGNAYCVDGVGDTILDCLLSISPDTWNDILPPK